MRQMQSGGSGAVPFGKSRARMLSDKSARATLEDVAGIDEVKEDLGEIIDFLKEPGKYTSLGGRIPKGVLLLGQPVFSQVLNFFSHSKFRQCVNPYKGNYRVRSFTCYDQFACKAFAQVTYRESLRDIECCLRAMRGKLYHAGIRGKVSRSTLRDANENRDWRIYSDFAQVLIHEARGLYVDEDFGLELKETVYALDSSTIDLCLSLFPWARFRSTKAAVKLHTLLDLRGDIPKNNYPEKLRRMKFFDVEKGRSFVFLTNQFLLPAVTIAELYRYRWRVEIFFKWIKQHLRIKSFYGTSEYAVKTQIWIAISIYVLVAIMKKRLRIDLPLYTILQILSISLFEKMPILEALTADDYINRITTTHKQLKLFES